MGGGVSNLRRLEGGITRWGGPRKITTKVSCEEGDGGDVGGGWGGMWGGGGDVGGLGGMWGVGRDVGGGWWSCSVKNVNCSHYYHHHHPWQKIGWRYNMERQGRTVLGH